MNNIAPSAERPLQGTDTIRSQVILRTLVALVLIVVTVSLAIGLPLYFDLKERNQKDIQALTDAEVVSVKQYVARLQSVAEQVTSRTQIRKKLAAFNAGQVTEPELVEYTEPKLRDALSKAADAVGITRLDATRQPVVTVGVSVPTDWLETLDLSARRTVLFGPRRIDGDQTIIVASPILGQEDDPIGYDLVLFYAEPLEALVRRGTELGETAELLLTYREGQRLHPLFGPLDEESERFLLRLSGDLAAGHAADDRLDYPCCPDCVVAIRAVEETGWLLVLRIERGEVDAILNAMFERLLLISAMVLMVGMTGVYLLTGPLLRRLDRELEVHQGMVRALEQSDAQLRTSQRALERDIEQRKALEQRLNREHEALEHERGLLKTLVQTLPELIWLKGPDGSYLACNAEFERFFGAPEADIVGKTDYHFIDRDLADGFREHDDKTMSGDSISVKEEWVTYRSDGRRVLLETTKLPMKDGRGQLTGVLGIGHDVTQRKLTEQALRESTRRYEAMLASTLDGFLVADTDARILEVNETYCRCSGYSREELLELHIWDLDANETPDEVKRHIEHMADAGGAIFETVHRRKDGSRWQLEVSVSYASVQGGRLFAFMRDITERYQEGLIGKLRERLAAMVYSDDQPRLLQAALDTAEALTCSEIGFFHYVEEDQETLSLQAWSTRTQQEMCRAEGAGLHYPVSEAGVWVDCIHRRAPVVHNDYASLPNKKGMPKGHATLLRELTVPVLRGERIVAVVGVGNKVVDYDDRDVSLVQRVAEICFDFVERKRAEEKVQFMAYHDPLTGLPNRQLLLDQLHRQLVQGRGRHAQVAVCSMDLDDFKRINDRYGLEIGDHLLVQIALRLQEKLRDGDTVARIGGDEFVILLTDLGPPLQAEEIIQRLLRDISQPFDVGGNRFHLSASIGMTLFPEDQAGPDMLLRHADEAMYRAKEDGRNRYRLFDPVHQEIARAHQRLLDEFDHAIDQSQLVLHYQPRIDLRSSALAGAEALVRWQHPQRGLLPPGEFLPTIAGTSLEIALDEWVVNAALDQHLRWREQGLTLPVSVNICPQHIQQQSFSEHLRRLLSKYPKDLAGYLELEVLETSEIGDTAQVAEVMTACAELGVSFALDDFGTGYSSLTYFHRLPVKVLKIDQSFVRGMLNDARDQDIVEGVLRLADALKRPVVAEGVESIELGLMLMQLGCRYAQGYGIARPMPAEQVLDWSEEWKRQGAWHRFHEEIRGLTPHSDLNISIFAHRQWVSKLKAYLTSGLDTERPVLDADACLFHRWYEGVGVMRYGHRPSYAFIQGKHAAVHAIGREMVDDAEQQRPERALARFDELDQLSRELTDALLELAED